MGHRWYARRYDRPSVSLDRVVLPAVSDRDPGRTVIRPSQGWVSLRLDELWASRELLGFFVWRDLKVRYRQTAFGALWAVLQPLALMTVFTLVLGGVSGLAPDGTPYALFTLTALVPWTLFSQSLIGASDSLVAAANLILKVYFPRLLLPMAAAASYLLDYAIGLVLLALFLSVFGVTPGLEALWVVPLTVLAVGAALGVGIWLAAINVRYRDVRYAVPFLVQVWLFASPVAYSSDVVPEPLRWLYFLNPMAGVIDGFRWALLGVGAPPLAPVAVSALVTFVVLLGGLATFRRVERDFADVI
jgi:lipopolysaccharide transport system permease protein